ncbi:MAG: ABC transporter ATP-binding protein [Bdellovibrionales bacterium]|nr:ABC transporter ATP-binding protein [Bdellovibrionales bacterium]
MKSFKFLYRNLDHFRNLFWICVFAAFLDGIVQFLIPILLTQFTKHELTQARFQQLAPYIVACFVFSLVFQWIIRRWGEALAYKFSDYLRLKYFEKLECLPLNVLQRHHSGYLHSLVDRIAQGGQSLLFQCIWLLAHGAATLSLFFIFTAKESVSIAGFNLLMMLFFLYVSVQFSKKMVPLAEALNFAHAKLVGRFVDLMSNVQTIQRLGVFSFANTQLSAEVKDNAHCIQLLQNFHANRWFCLHLIFGACFLLTIVYLLYLITLGSASASILILFIWAFGVVRSQIERFSELIKSLLELDAYVASLNEILQSIESDTEQVSAIASFDVISLSDIVVRYEGATQNISIPLFELRRGEKVLVTGESGQGKSTLLDVLGYLQKPQAGSVAIDGRSYRELGVAAIRSQIAIVSQEVELFDMSVRDNLVMGAEISEQSILELLIDLQLGPWFESLPDGLDTLVGEKGVKLSVGQKQRVNIARGLLLDRPVILFDEPTSHLDQNTEEAVIAVLEKWLGEKTVVFVSHRPEIGRLCGAHYRFESHSLVRCSCP